jgi:hypothetical protein
MTFVTSRESFAFHSEGTASPFKKHNDTIDTVEVIESPTKSPATFFLSTSISRDSSRPYSTFGLETETKMEEEQEIDAITQASTSTSTRTCSQTKQFDDFKSSNEYANSNGLGVSASESASALSQEGNPFQGSHTNIYNSTRTITNVDNSTNNEFTTLKMPCTARAPSSISNDQLFPFDFDSRSPSLTSVAASRQSIEKSIIEEAKIMDSPTRVAGYEHEHENKHRPLGQHYEIDCPSVNTTSTTPFSLSKSPPSITTNNHNYTSPECKSNNPPTTPISQSKRVQRNKKKTSRAPKTQRVQPVVYSAIGSLEKVNQHNMGSFNNKVHLASQRNEKGHRRRENGHENSLHHDHEHPRNFNHQIPNLQPPQSTFPKSQSLGQFNNDNNDDDHYGASIQRPSSNVKKNKKKHKKKKKVTIDSKVKEIRQVEIFRPSCDAYTPRMERKQIKYKPAEERASMETMSTTMGTIQKPNFRDALRRVAMIIQQHIVKIEERFESGSTHLNLFTRAMRDAFAEENFVTPRYKYSMVNIPMGRAGVVYGMRKIRNEYKIPSADDIYEFAHQLFKQVQLSSECSIICLIYVERLMEVAKVPLMANTWKPIIMCGLLLASKVWQDWASWNIEFASVYPQFSLDNINKLEVKFCKVIKWNLYISSSLYAKYYFALRSLLEKQNFRRRYVQMVGGVNNVAASEAIMISKRSEIMKEKALSHLSLSM